jgi:hypothetical protein
MNAYSNKKERDNMKKARILFSALSLSLACLLLPAASSAVVVSNADQLAQAVMDANSGGDNSIFLEDGVYTLSDMLWVDANNLTVRSVSGNREAVVIQGQGMYGPVSHVFNVAGSNFTVSDVTLGEVGNHAIQTQPSAQAPVIRNVHFINTYEQMVKIAWDANNPDAHTDNGILENCLFEYTAGIGPQWYIGGIDAHRAMNWQVRNNTFRYIRSPADDVAEFAIHFWSNSENTLVENNVIVSCDRGIGFGLGDRGHIGGTIRNNMIYHDASEGFADVGIALESAWNAHVYNNTIYFDNSYPNAIEYRWGATSGVVIANNLTNRAITSRDGGSGDVFSNVTSASWDWFVDPASGNLRLSYAVGGVVDSGSYIDGLTNDIDGKARPQGGGYDIGASEW